MKTISKINETIFNLVSEIAELQDTKHDFDTRSGKICANIKVYEWIDEDDVLTICKKKNISPKQAKKVLKEFNEDRLNNIHSHVCEDEIRSLKEQYEDNCDLSNFAAIFSTWRRANNTDKITKEFYMETYKQDSYYIDKYWNEAQKFTSLELWKKHIIKQAGNEYKEWQKRNFIDKFECWQYGRSGGWFSICDEDEANCTILDDNYDSWLFDDLEKAYNEDDNRQFNEVINNYIDRETKQQFLKSLRSLLKDYNDKINAITEIVQDIEDGKKYFKENLLHQLDYEIDEFINNEFLINKTNVTIKIENDKIKTSLGVTVDEIEFKNAFNLLLPKFNSMNSKEKFSISKKVGNYFVEYAKKTKNDVIIKAGCHRFSLNNIMQVLNYNPI
jgi:hypothetical protein